MKKRRTGIETMSAAFLDVIACALGGTLLLLLISKTESAKSITAYSEALSAAQASQDAASSKLKSVSEELKSVKEEIEEEKREFENTVKALGSAIENLKDTQASLAGIKGELKNVVFVLDLSGSMTGSLNSKNELVERPQLVKRFKEVKAKIAQLVERLDFEQFAIVGFGGTSDAQPRIVFLDQAWVRGTPENRANAQVTIERWEAAGGTPTLAALQRAFQFKDVDTVILYSDGEPTIPIANGNFTKEQTEKLKAEVLAWLKKENSKSKVAVNTVPIGSYNSDTLERFMRRIADENGGICAPF